MTGRARLVVAPYNEVPAGDEFLSRLAAVDQRFRGRVVTAPAPPGDGSERVVLSPCGSLGRETDDVRSVGEAASAAALAAFSMGASHLSLEVAPEIASMMHTVDGPAFTYAALVAELAVHQAAHVPLQAQHVRSSSLVELSVTPNGASAVASAIEQGCALARDVGAGDPEVMAPLRIAAHVKAMCEPLGVHVEVVDDITVLNSEYPLLMAVARASLPVERHRPCVVRLSWQGEGPVERTVCIAGKGVTYDTGGADIKVGGSMAGMRIDKCGAGAAAGFIVACATAPQELTKGLKVVVELGCVRNSVGADMYVADEIITGHAGKRVLVGNTDAEGRMVLADCLSHLRARALTQSWPNTQILSVATLTGHAARSFGPNAVALDSGAARAAGGIAPQLATAGALLGTPLEVSMLRREDYAFIAPGNSNTPVSRVPPGSYDVLQCNNGASATTVRGHQFPMAFLDVASGLQSHGAGSEVPLPYCHVDLAGSIIDGRGVETGSPIRALFGHFVMRLGSMPKSNL